MKFWSNSEIAPQSSQIPEKRLLAAVLQRAITDYLSGEGDMRDGAENWLFSDDESDAPLSFAFICEALDLDMDSLRVAIRVEPVVENEPVRRVAV
jgi:hypothetical protein